MRRFLGLLLSLQIAAPLLNASCCHTCARAPYPSNTGFVTPAPILHSSNVWSFVSAKNLHPMKVKVQTFKRGTSSGSIFLAPYGFSSTPMYGQSGALILESDGTPVWFRPLKSPNLMNTDFRVQQLYGENVLTFWQGTLATPPAYTNAPGGSSEPGSCYYILDNHYRVVRTLSAKRGYTSDIHEFLLTPQNTALFLSTKTVPMDLRPYGGAENGYVQDFAIQEIDVKTGKLLFFWNALAHIPLSDSYEPISNAALTGNIWDAFHLNSIGLTPSKDDLIVSSRSTWTIYKINKRSKKIVWQLGGKQSDFKIEQKAQFSWQHDARYLSKHIISLFDDNSDGSSTQVPPSHGLEIRLNFKKMKAYHHHSYFHNPNISVASQGNVETLSSGNKFVGWGQSQYYSEFKKGGNGIKNPAHNLVYEATMPGSNNFSYRAYRHQWVGKPHYPPSCAAYKKGEHIAVYASWNGSTETKKWRLYAGHSRHHLSFKKSVSKRGFETKIHSPSDGPYFQVKAVDVNGHVIGVSKIFKAK